MGTSCWSRACEERVTESKTRIIFGVPISCYISWPILNSVGQLLEIWASVRPLSLQVNFHTQGLFIGTPTRCVKSQVCFHTALDDNLWWISAFRENSLKRFIGLVSFTQLQQTINFSLLLAAVVQRWLFHINHHCSHPWFVWHQLQARIPFYAANINNLI